jgi:hypothetical protein
MAYGPPFTYCSVFYWEFRIELIDTHHVLAYLIVKLIVGLGKLAQPSSGAFGD